MSALEPRSAVTDQGAVSISTRLLMRLVVLLIAIWSLLSGMVLVAFQGAGSDALGAGIADEPGQRLVGAHLLILTPVYLLMAWRPERYTTLLWLPLAAQLAVFATVAYSMIHGDTEFGDGVLPAAIGAIFSGLLAFLWLTEQRTAARIKFEARNQSSPENAQGSRLATNDEPEAST